MKRVPFTDFLRSLVSPGYRVPSALHSLRKKKRRPLAAHV
jgi:hypothetical protein